MSIRGVREVRAWQPGDGLTCETRAYKDGEIPCGPPVVTAIYDGGRNTYRESTFAGRPYGMSGQPVEMKRKVYCATHIPTGLDPGRMRTLAKKAAMEQLAADNWDTYQALVKQHLAKKIADQLDFLPQEVRAGVIDLMSNQEAPHA